eukprot:gene9210-10184_t
MTRHGKNCTAGAVYTYHEKKKDTQSSGYGSQSERLSKDSIKEFDCCGLTLQPCRDPVITPSGYLYDREAILEYIVHKKQEYAKAMKLYEKQKRKLQAEEAEKFREGEKSKVSNFVKHERSITTKDNTAFKSSGAEKTDTTAGPSKPSGSGALSNVGDGKRKNLPSFWIPSLTPQAKSDTLKKPENKVYCPLSGKSLRLKDLYPVKFTELPSDDKRSLISKEVRYICPVTHDLLGNSVPCAVLKPSGHVVTMDCVENIIKKDWICPLTGEKLKEDDIIQMNRGGTGFSGAGKDIKAKIYRPTMQT